MAQKKRLQDKADKRRRAKVVVGHDADGEPIIKYASGRNQAELDANKEELKRSHINGVMVRRDAMAGQYIPDWYAAFVKPGVSESTHQHYMSALNKHILPAIGDKQMRAVTAFDLQAIMNSTGNLRRSTVGYVKTLLYGSFKAALATGVIDRDPSVTIKPRTAESSERRALTPKEEKAALKVAGEHPDGLLLHLLYYTGMRRGEALGLMWTDIDFKTGVIHVLRDIDYATNNTGTVKTAASVRDIPIPIPLRGILAPRIGIGYVIASPRTKQFLPQSTYIRTWKSLMASLYQADPSIDHADLNAKVKAAPPLMGSMLTAHYFRHNYASMLHDAGVDVLSAQKYLGHSDPATTLRIYTHLSSRKERRDKKKVVELFGR